MPASVVDAEPTLPASGGLTALLPAPGDAALASLPAIPRPAALADPLPAVVDGFDPIAPAPPLDAVVPPALAELLDPAVEFGTSDGEVADSVVCGAAAWQLAIKLIHPPKHQHRSLRSKQ
jgi:hypothetical protein